MVFTRLRTQNSKRPTQRREDGEIVLRSKLSGAAVVAFHQVQAEEEVTEQLDPKVAFDLEPNPPSFRQRGNQVDLGGNVDLWIVEQEEIIADAGDRLRAVSRVVRALELLTGVAHGTQEIELRSVGLQKGPPYASAETRTEIQTELVVLLARKQPGDEPFARKDQFTWRPTEFRVVVSTSA